MKLWILRPVATLDSNDNPWGSWYDKYFRIIMISGFVVRAETEEDARNIAHKNAGDENKGEKEPWRNPKYSTCIELIADGEPEIVVRNFMAT